MVNLESLLRSVKTSIDQYHACLRKAGAYTKEGKMGLANASYKEASMKKIKAQSYLNKAVQANIHSIKKVTFTFGDKKYLYTSIDMDDKEIEFFLKIAMKGMTGKDNTLEILEIQETKNLIQEVSTI